MDLEQLWDFGRPAGSAAYFQEAVTLARDAALEALHVDALHMLALLPTDPAEQLCLNEEALAIQLTLAEELRAAGQDDPYVQEELALLLGPDASDQAAEEGPGDAPATS